MTMKNILSLVLLLLIISCKEAAPKKVTDEETPKALVDETSMVSYSSLLKGTHRGSVVDKLYAEALENNKNLEQLDAKMNDIYVNSLNTVENEYLNYKRTNNTYWTTIEDAVGNMSDSITKQSTMVLIEKMKRDYAQKLSSHENKMLQIRALQAKLKDQKILMKFLITQPMIEKYQDNELPDIKKMEKIINDYHQLIEQTKAYTQSE